MGPEVVNRNKNCVFNGPYVGRDLYITMLQDTEREFVVTHNANIKPVSYFTGREKELRELRQRIEERRKSVLVSGMGGIGKTHICRKLFEEYLNRYAEGGNVAFRHIGYVEYVGNMDSSLIGCLKYRQQDNPERNREAAWRELEYLASDGKLLLFVDNVDKTMKDDPSLWRLNGIPGAVILTSRQTSISEEFESYRIGFLSTEQCMEIYERIQFDGSGGKVKPEEVQDLKYVIEQLVGRHTITVELLAHMARTKLWTVKRLREELEKKGFQLQFRKNGELINIQKSYEVLYDLAKLIEAEKNILEAFSVFPYIPLAAEICNEWLLADSGANEDDDILVGLYQKGWLQFDRGQESYSMHPVFARFICEKCKPKWSNHLGMVKGCRKLLEIPEGGSVLECREYIPFAESILEKIAIGEEQIEFINVLADLLIHEAEYSKAKKLCEGILSFLRDISKENTLIYALTYDNLVMIYEKQKVYGKLGEGIGRSRIEVEIQCKNYHNYIIEYKNLASLYVKQGKYREAEELYRQVLRIMEQLCGENQRYTVKCYADLAMLYREWGKYGEERKVYEKILWILESEFGEYHLNTAIGYNNLAEVYEIQGDYKRAKELYDKVLRIREDVLRKGHAEIATSYNNLGRLYTKMGEYTKAEELYKKGLGIFEKELGDEHLETAAMYGNLACIYVSQGEYKRAEKLYKKYQSIFERKLGEDDPDIAACYNNIAYLYCSQKEYMVAITYTLKAYKIFVNKFGLDNPSTQIIYENMELAFKECNPEGNFEQWLEEKMKEQ